MSKLAPIGILAYSRVDHLKKTIVALRNNTLANQSDLYIFLDGPKEGDEEIVARTRNYVSTIDGFNNVIVIERQENDIVENFESGMQMLFHKYGRCIYMDDDIVTAPGFLQFMNGALEFSKDHKQVFSVTGYCPPINADKYCMEDFYILPRFCAWGFGIWKNRYDQISKISFNEYEKFRKNRKAVKRFINGGGEDMLPMLKMEVDGEINTTDVKAWYRQFVNQQYTVYPRKSLVSNCGNDGTGLHCGKTDKFDVELWSKINFRFKNNLVLNEKLLRANRKFRKPEFKNKLIKITQSLGLYEHFKKVQRIVKF